MWGKNLRAHERARKLFGRTGIILRGIILKLTRRLRAWISDYCRLRLRFNDLAPFCFRLMASRSEVQAF